jgi:predicted RNA-binding protein with TRAM domain
VEDIHESGAGVGRTEDGFIVLVDGVLPDARAKVRIDTVRSSLAWAEEVERLPLEAEEDDDAEDEAQDGPDLDEADPAAQDDDAEDEAEGEPERRAERERLGSRDNFWGKDD